MFSRGPRVRPLRPAGAQAAIDLALRDPLVHALAGSRLLDLQRAGRFGQEFAVHGEERAPSGVLWQGVNLSPVGASPAAIDAFGELWAQRSRRCASIVGDRAAIERLWTHLEPAWQGQVRQYRWSQPLLVAREDAAPVPPEWRSGVRPAVRGEEDRVFPAAVAMFTEEVGTDPTAHDGGRGYRLRVQDLIARSCTYVVMHGGRVVFKADVGAVLGPVAQIHGVWVDPAHRGQGIGRAAMRELADLVRRDHAPRVSLYVNDFNEPARRAYAAAGFEQAGELSTILF